ncbi:MAG TPA: TetR/AcrR family transcriptional regulator [Eubacteriaceae bacterium]|nr:TetR/AcrR family transcriptional regulator [Eubacteriaceae bacterium]
MEDIKYSDKEIAIFKGLIQLIREGVNPYSIKVSDIAKAANIGKGTIYDYFGSKEEVISKAIIYSVGEEIKTITDRIKTKESFKDRFYEVLDTIEKNINDKVSILSILVSSGGIEKFYEFLRDKEYTISNFIELVHLEIKELLDFGRTEGIITAKETEFHQIMTVLGVISSFSYYYNNKDFHKNISTKEAKDTVYRILLKSLN